ncbi:MAG: GlsB/YeaQ/YmgE family stress response membrane protein [Chloroflexota bacterium]|nr:MAG: GlsB/YeaQ/YmgE family stress response membrane protein [Chloroflexota bacterium]
MTFESIIIWIIVGAIVGILLDTVIGGMRMGLMGAVLIGIVGAIISGWAFYTFGFHFLSGIIGTIVEAAIGSVLLLLIFGVFRRF